MNELPSIERWWPPLSAHAKHSIQRDLDAPIEAAVLVEIALIVGFAVDEKALTQHEKDFIETQGQPVD